jgi:hypothetical protein
MSYIFFFLNFKHVPLSMQYYMLWWFYIYMELLVKPEMLTSYIYGPTFDNAESRLFLFSPQCFNTESMQKVILLCVNTLLATKFSLVTDGI